jgi:signal transduction histidine kinase
MPELSEKVLARLNRIERSAKHSTELITALLHLSRGEKQAPNDGESTEVGSILHGIVDSHRHHLLGKPIAVQIDIDAPLHVAAPEAVLSVVIGNLIANAFKYTREGEVRIRVDARGVSVQDTGPGIPEAERDRVFERHFRGSTGSGSGAGLGLSILNRLCALYGWQVSLKPREPHGLEAALLLGPSEQRALTTAVARGTSG